MSFLYKSFLYKSFLYKCCASSITYPFLYPSKSTTIASAYPSQHIAALHDSQHAKRSRQLTNLRLRDMLYKLYRTYVSITRGNRNVLQKTPCHVMYACELPTISREVNETTGQGLQKSSSHCDRPVEHCRQTCLFCVISTSVLLSNLDWTTAIRLTSQPPTPSPTPQAL